MQEILNAFLFVVFGVGAMLLYFYGSNWILDTVLADQLEPSGRAIKSYTNLRARIRPWLFVAPALIFLGVYLLYPALATFFYSFFDANSEEFVGLANYQWAFGNDGFRQSVFNNFLWILVVPFASTAFGLLIAVLADRVRWESIAKSFIFMPMAISFVGASIIWKFVYDFNPPGSPQIGIVNAVFTSLGFEPINWLNTSPVNNFLLMIILIWIQTGFAMVVLSSALKGVPNETIEAGRIDGANEIRIFFRIMIPQIMNTVTVVITTILITTLKVFDIVQVMTNGQSDTEVLGNFMFRWMFRGTGDDGKASVIALTIMVATIPFLIMNLRRFQAEEQMR